MKITNKEIESTERRKRATLINSLSGYRQAVLVGTCSSDKKTNLAIFNSLIHLGADPALWGLVFRPQPEERDTYRNILETGYYTLNYINRNMVEQAHQTSAKYSNEISEFDACGFKPAFESSFIAPYVTESPVRIGIKLQQTIEIELNKTVLVIGSVEEIHVPDGAINTDGFINLSALGIIASCGLDAYFETSLLSRYSYAKPQEDRGRFDLNKRQTE